MIGIILLNMGGPDSLEAVKPFLKNLFSDRDIIRLGPAFLQKYIASLIISLRLKKTKEIYGLIGGKSPLADITNAQAAALEALMNREGSGIRVYVGMRYWRPFISDTLAAMHRDGVKKILALSMYPHYSVATTGSTLKAFEQAMKQYGTEYSCITSWFDHPGYIEAFAEKITLELRGRRGEDMVLFSAHSLPQKFIDEGDPYAEQIKGTVQAVAAKTGISWRLSYQSKTGPVKWLEPTTEAMLRELAAEGVRDLLVAPVSFVSDHIETLYEIDMLYKEEARSLGINLRRTESLNTSPLFIKALADLASDKLRSLNWL